MNLNKRSILILFAVLLINSFHCAMIQSSNRKSNQPVVKPQFQRSYLLPLLTNQTIANNMNQQLASIFNQTIGSKGVNSSFQYINTASNQLTNMLKNQTLALNLTQTLAFLLNQTMPSSTQLANQLINMAHNQLNSLIGNQSLSLGTTQTISFIINQTMGSSFTTNQMLSLINNTAISNSVSSIVNQMVTQWPTLLNNGFNQIMNILNNQMVTLNSMINQSVPQTLKPTINQITSLSQTIMSGLANIFNRFG
jgi:hypothetical protein